MIAELPQRRNRHAVACCAGWLRSLPLLVAIPASMADAQAGPPPAVALVIEIAGSVQREEGSGPARRRVPLDLVAEVRPGDVIALGAQSSAVLAYTGQDRIDEAHGPGRVRAGAESAVAIDASARIVQRPLPPALGALRIKPVTAAQASIVMRGGGDALELLSPTGPQLEARARLLRWRADAAKAEFVVRLIDDDGAVVFEAATDGTELALPASLSLAREREYVWTLDAAFGGGGRATTAAAFSLVPALVESRIDAARAEAGDVFSSRVALAVALEQLGLQQEADEAWHALGRGKGPLQRAAQAADVRPAQR